MAPSDLNQDFSTYSLFCLLAPARAATSGTRASM